MKASVVLSGRLAGLNEIVAQARYNRFAGASQKKQETQRCQWAIVAACVPVFTKPVRVSFKWVEQNLKRDPDNVSAGGKFFLDALVELKKIPNDTRKWIKGLVHEFPDPDPVNPRIEISIEELEG